MTQAADPRLHQAMSLLRERKPDEALALCRRILAEQPGEPEPSLLLARIARERGGAEESVRVLRESRPHPAIEPELAASLVVANRPTEAMPILQRLSAAQPQSPFPHYWLGQAYLKLWKPAEGIRCLETVRRLDPRNIEVLYSIGAALLAAGRPKAAEGRLREYLASRPNSIPGMHALAGALDYQNRADEAEATYRSILERAPGYPPALAGLARRLQGRAQHTEGLALIEPALDPQRPDPELASIYAGLCHGAGRPEAARAAVERSLGAARLPAQVESSLRFALARIEEAAGADDLAFDQYQRANDLFPRTFNPDARRRFTDDMIAAFTAETMRGMPRASNRSERPVIVCGMPRSGTTLVEQIIASHPAAFGAGELPLLRAAFNELGAQLPGRPPANLIHATGGQLDAAADRYLQSLAEIDADAARVVDKMPHNCEILGFIRLLLPGAKFIHCTRDPLDTCASCYMTQLSPVHDYANRLEDLGFAFGQYRRLMDHWRQVLDPPMLEVAYEDLVDDVEAGARRIIEFLGLPWDERCLRFYENARLVSTASVDQVRRPIYRSSVARWKRHERRLGPLREALRAAGVEV